MIYEFPSDKSWSWLPFSFVCFLNRSQAIHISEIVLLGMRLEKIKVNLTNLGPMNHSFIETNLTMIINMREGLKFCNVKFTVQSVFLNLQSVYLFDYWEQKRWIVQRAWLKINTSYWCISCGKLCGALYVNFLSTANRMK